MKIRAGLEVELDFVMLDEDGETIESSEDDGPMVYVQGEGEIPPKLEEALEGAEPGARLEVELEPADAFGEYDPEGIVSVPRADFPAGVELEEGEWVEVALSDEDDDEAGGHHHEHGEHCAHGEEDEGMEARIVQFDDEVVVLDTNHPLAGQRLTFRVEVRAVRAPASE